MLQFQDIQIADNGVRQQFMALWAAGSYQAAIDLLTNGGVAANRIMTADNVNNIIQQINALNKLSGGDTKEYRPIVSDTEPSELNPIWFDSEN